MPCLNEAETIERCIVKARNAFRAHGISGEVVIGDNGSTDGSQDIARRLGAQVIPVRTRGYGSALRGAIHAARGRYVIMGDSDDSYDFSAIEPFVARLREGFDLVMGNRFKGGVLPGAMPWKHRWIGNPVLTGIGRLFFGSASGDFHCGLRGFSKEAYRRMDLRTTGMEFASEMVIKSTLAGLRVSEVPVILHKDGRSRPPHLRSWRDGWRHLRFMLLFSPLWLFLIPGAVMLLCGLVGGAWLMRGPQRVGSVELDVHTLLACSLLAVVGFQTLVFGIFTKTFAVSQGIHPPHPWLTRFNQWTSLERGLLTGLFLVVAGLGWLIWAVVAWRNTGFGALEPRAMMRLMIPAATVFSLGFQTVFSSFFLSVLSINTRPPES
ncbi:MAG TPA: glycosyltransferase family 2 protein [Planctomycetota bacterium]|nr:glycosyltransferase family 2 protein [Planctomycetota bacterium]